MPQNPAMSTAPQTVMGASVRVCRRPPREADTGLGGPEAVVECPLCGSGQEQPVEDGPGTTSGEVIPG